MTEDDEDPFDRLGDVDREGDPFERLDDGAGDEADAPTDTPAAGAGAVDDADGAAADRSSQSQTDPFADFDAPASDTSAATGEAAGPTDGGAAVDDPFADLEARGGDPFASGQSAFERVDVGSVDADDLWDEITDEDEVEPAVPDEDRYAEVSKHAFCEQCDHFSAPPEAHCTHETAEIIEYLDMERVRVLDCPVVAQRRELE